MLQALTLVFLVYRLSQVVTSAVISNDTPELVYSSRVWGTLPWAKIKALGVPTLPGCYGKQPEILLRVHRPPPPSGHFLCSESWRWWLRVRPLPLTLLPRSSILKGASLLLYLAYVDNLELSILKFLICSYPSCSVSQALMIKIRVFGDTHSEYHIHLILRVPTKTNSKKFHQQKTLGFRLMNSPPLSLYCPKSFLSGQLYVIK